jgi:ABC-2 type transport system permease protein
VIANPNSDIAQILSYIPFSAPIVLMARVPYAAEIDGFYFQFVLSLLSLAIGVLVTMWLASRVYRIGIMVYGQKVGYKEIFKWMFSGD